MRLMSFSKTTAQILARSKLVTRRIGWIHLPAGTRLIAIEKGQGLKLGEKVNALDLIEVVSVRREPLRDITRRELKLEGLPHLSREQFIELFDPLLAEEFITRIQFRYVLTIAERDTLVAGQRYRENLSKLEATK